MEFRRAVGLSSLVAGLLIANVAAAAQCIGDPSTLSHGNPPRARVQPPMDPPNCGGGFGTGMVLDDYVDNDGDRRYACLSRPASVPQGGLPLLVFLHPSLYPADTVYVATNLPEQMQTADLTGDPNRPGFILLAPQGRNTTHFYPWPDHQGAGWDNWYRNTDPAKERNLPENQAENVDVAAIDHYIHAVVAQGIVDPKRIYVSGWSNGSAMAILYGQARPGLIAAVGVYSAPNPYGDFDDPCPVKSFAAVPPVPIFHVHNDCDITGICPSGQAMAQTFVRNRVPTSDQLIDSTLQPAARCLDQCRRSEPQFPGTDEYDYPGLGPDSTLGTANHGRWPLNWTPAFFHFFQLHPRR
ncbi:MAG: hypothetical protein QOD06_1766 [Candidatus Binatota bacterium]|nr:hypothetical protein [Candidatus Binatota bacterium]